MSALVGAFAAIVALEVFDWLTGPSVSFALLFLMPIVLLAWVAGARVAVAAAVFAVTCEAIVDLSWPQVHGLPVYIWNSLSRAGVLIFSAIAVARIRDTTGQLVAANSRLDHLYAAERVAREDTDLRFGLVADTLTDFAIVLFDSRGTAQTWSAATSRITGRDASSITGRSMDELFPPVAEEGTTQRVDWRAVRTEVERWTLRDGGHYWASIVAYGLAEPPHRRQLAIVRDATARKLSEEALRRARDEAVAATRELETFSYTVAHDLRAPLRALDGLGAILEEEAAGRLDDKALAVLTRIREAGQRMGRLVDDLLELSRLGRTPLRPTQVDVSALARRIDRELREANPGRAVDTLVADGMVVEADAHLLEVLVRNLLENAWKFTSHKPRARIEVGCLGASDPTFFVRDDGAGFDMRYVDRLFRPFERLHSAQEFAGTGIGLATVRRVVERHGGRAWAEGEVGKGATVYFTLYGAQVGEVP
ncbi:MAG: sensor histidine kinase [Myxococcota bacterium]